jgi:CheY-like chemotaxis protein
MSAMFLQFDNSSIMYRGSSSARRRVGPILLVDDYDDARAVAREALEDAGHTVLEAKDGQEALNILVSQAEMRPAVIVLDLQMPVMDGWRFIELISCYVGLASIPIIIATAREARLEIVTHKAVVSCLTAPYDLKDLVKAVDRCVDPDAEPNVSAR